MTDRVERLLLTVEANIHRAGWDQPPEMFLITDETANPETGQALRLAYGDPLATHDGLVAFPLITHETMSLGLALAGSPGNAFWSLAAFIAYGADPGSTMMRGMLIDPATVGVGMCVEVWERHDTADAFAGLRGKKFADMPGSLEARRMCVHVRGRGIVTLGRLRGHKPEIEPLSTQVGSVYDTVRLLGMIVEDTIPPREMLHEAFPSVESVIEAARRARS